LAVDGESVERRTAPEPFDEERNRPARDDRDDAVGRGQPLEDRRRARQRESIVGIRDDLSEGSVVIDDDPRRGRLRRQERQRPFDGRVQCGRR
jgi:hypothetical protein